MSILLTCRFTFRNMILCNIYIYVHSMYISYFPNLDKSKSKCLRGIRAASVIGGKKLIFCYASFLVI